MSDPTINSIFTPGGADAQQPRNSEVYRISYKASKSGKYTSVVRFVPFYKNPSKNIVSKFVSWVVNPFTTRGMYVDDPRSVGKPSPVTEKYWVMQNTNIATYQEWAKKNIGGKQQYASLVQILRDDIHPELVGQIKVFVYGKKVYDKLHSEEFPENGQQGINPFDPFRGRKFSLVCENVSNYNNFDNSSFYDDKDPTGTQILPSGIWYQNPETGQFEIAVESMPEKNRQYLVDYLAANSPDLSAYEYQEWTTEQTNHVNEVLQIATNFLSTGRCEPVAQATTSAAYQTMFGGQPSGTPVPPAPAAPAATPAAPVAPAAPVFPGATATPGVSSSAPAAPVTLPQTAVVPPVVPPTTATAPVAQVVPPTTPAAQPQSAAPSTGFAPVAPPQVTPQGAPAAAAATAPSGMNVDDILSQL